MESIEKDLNNYLVSDSYNEDTVNLFYNLATFAKNMEIKNGDKYDQAETDFSSWFGEILIKYCERGLNDSDIIALIRNVCAYNKAVEDELSNLERYPNMRSFSRLFS